MIGKFFQSLNQTEKFLSYDYDMIQFRNEWRPTSNITFYTTLDFYYNNTINQNSKLETDIFKINNKLEYKPNMHSLFTVQ